jgi:hypothetical protein
VIKNPVFWMLLMCTSCASCSQIKGCDSYRETVNDGAQRLDLINWAKGCFNQFPLHEELLIAGGLPGPGRRMIAGGKCIEDIPSNLRGLEVRIIGDSAVPRGFFVGHAAYRGIVVALRMDDDLSDLREFTDEDANVSVEGVWAVCRVR